MEGGSNLWGAGFMNCIVVVVVLVVELGVNIILYQTEGNK